MILAFSLRIYDISSRPLHTDEAVNSVKLKYLLEQNEFIYNPIEYHGPTLFYFSLASAWVFGVDKFENLDEFIIRVVPLIFSLLLFLVVFIVRKSIFYLSFSVIILFLIISPYINFYSRYFIHESVFTTFTFLLIVSYYKFNKTSNLLWIILSGVFTGLLFATKETSLIIFISFVISIFATKTYKSINGKSIILFVISFIIVSVIFYSSFFSNPQGIFDAVLSYKNYFIKSASNNEHVQPWFYYIKIISYNKLDGYIISEAVILVLGIIGIIYSFKNNLNESNNVFFKLLAVFTLISAIIFSILPYKTPWNMFNWWIGIIFLSGFGFAKLIESIKNGLIKKVLILFLFLSSAHLIFQVYLTSYQFSSSPENPYTYSQPTKEIYLLTNKVEELIEYKGDVLINTVAEGNEYWPLPWYFRKAKNVAWNSLPPDNIYKFDLIITQPKLLDLITEKLYTIPPPGEKNLYVPFITKEIPIRPGNFFIGYIKNDLFQDFINDQNTN